MRTRTSALIVTALLATAGWAWAQSPASSAPEVQGMQRHMQMHASSPGDEPMGTMPDDCAAMMAARQAMMSDMKAMDVELDGLVTAMNAATGREKADATAAAVSALAKQRREMRVAMQSMQMKMMRHMMRHMHSSMASGTMEPMGDCPMMGEGEVAESGHGSHH